MHPMHAKVLESIYSRVEDVDLLLGGILEIPTKGAAVGPTFECLLKKQFIKPKKLRSLLVRERHPPVGAESSAAC